MTKTIDTTIELARYFDSDGKKQNITIAKYNGYVNKLNKEAIAEFIYQRLYSRYLKPFQFEDRKFIEQFKNGFSIMANCYLLIETLQSFKNGWEDSSNKSALAFKQFLSTEINFKVFKENERNFFVNIRCGILHQGESTGGWKINRQGEKLFDGENLKMDSVIFAKELEQSLKTYCNKLKEEKWDGEIWDNFMTKMRKIISNCER